MNAFRNLYKLTTFEGSLAAHITAASHEIAVEKYQAAGGDTDVVVTEQLTRGYPDDICAIYIRQLQPLSPRASLQALCPQASV